jgi:hypothetical protein
VPTQNMRPTPIFFFQCRFSVLSWAKGMANIQRSSAMLMAAFAHAIALLFRHFPSCSPSQLVQK